MLEGVSWVDPQRSVDEILAALPGAAELQLLLDEIAQGALDAATLELCRLRIAQLLGAEPPKPNHVTPEMLMVLRRWTDAPELTDRHRAALRFTEAYVIDASSVTDTDRKILLDHFSDAEAVALTTALATYDALTRTRLALSQEA